VREARSNQKSAVARSLTLDPHRYLHHVLERIAMHPINRLEELLPWRVAAQWSVPALSRAA